MIRATSLGISLYERIKEYLEDINDIKINQELFSIKHDIHFLKGYIQISEKF